MVSKVGGALAEQVREATLKIYRWAAAYAAERGIPIADTKFEFGTDEDGRLLRDGRDAHAGFPSRFWPADEYRAGHQPTQLRQQFVRDHRNPVPEQDRAWPGTCRRT